MLFKRRDSGFNNMAWSHVLHHVGIWIDAKMLCSLAGYQNCINEWKEIGRKLKELHFTRPFTVSNVYSLTVLSSCNVRISIISWNCQMNYSFRLREIDAFPTPVAFCYPKRCRYNRSVSSFDEKQEKRNRIGDID